MFNRNILQDIWDSIEFPSIIFLGDAEDQENLVSAVVKYQWTDLILEAVDNVIIISRIYEQNVLWIKGNVPLLPFLNGYLESGYFGEKKGE